MKILQSSLSTVLGIACVSVAAGAIAAPVSYEIDPSHTYPAFEADHMGGLSLWRGKFNTSSGSITLDKAASAGTVTVTMDVKSIDFGNQALNDHAQAPEFFDTAKFPTATYTGKLVDFKNGAPTAVDGTLTLHGVTKPLRLTVNSFLCKEDARAMKDRCGADALATFNRDEWGVDFGKAFGFKMGVTLRISVEALEAT